MDEWSLADGLSNLSCCLRAGAARGGGLWGPALRSLLRPSSPVQRTLDAFLAERVKGRALVSMHVRAHLTGEKGKLEAGACALLLDGSFWSECSPILPLISSLYRLLLSSVTIVRACVVSDGMACLGSTWPGPPYQLCWVAFLH